LFVFRAHENVCKKARFEFEPHQDSQMSNN